MLYPREPKWPGSLHFSAAKAFLLVSALTTFACSWSTSASANADVSSAQTESDALYFKALPLLDNIDKATGRYIELRRHAIPGQPVEDESTELATKVQSYLLTAVPLLQKSAEESNPAAQFRLGQIYSNYERRDQTLKQVCALYKASWSQGFAPAALAMTG